MAYISPSFHLSSRTSPFPPLVLSLVLSISPAIVQIPSGLVLNVANETPALAIIESCMLIGLAEAGPCQSRFARTATP